MTTTRARRPTPRARVGMLAAALAVLAGALPGCGGGPSAAGGGGPAAAYNVTVTLDTSTRYQVMQGFGGSLAFYANYLASHPHLDEISQLLFSDLGVQILRVGNWSGNSAGTAFDDSVALVQAARAATGGAGPLVLMSSWSPPAALKSTQKTTNGGTLASATGGGFRYADFGQWWSDALAAYASAGVVPDFISIQNEPDFTATWESCLFAPSETATRAGYDQALGAVTAALAASGAAAPKVLGPETSGLGGSIVENYLAPLAGPALSGLAGIAHHLYSGGTPTLPTSFNAGMSQVGAAAAAADKPLFMTEFSPSAGPDMFTTAWLIHNAVTVEGVAAYLYWGLIWAAPTSGPPGGLVTTENPFNQASWTTTNGYIINDTYYAVRHFSKWIGVGWQRVAIDSSSSFINASAFNSPDNQQVTLVLLNTDSDPHAVTLDAGALVFASSNVYRTSGTDERTAPIGALAGPITMPGRSLVTVTLGP